MDECDDAVFSSVLAMEEVPDDSKLYFSGRTSHAESEHLLKRRIAELEKQLALKSQPSTVSKPGNKGHPKSSEKWSKTPKLFDLVDDMSPKLNHPLIANVRLQKVALKPSDIGLSDSSDDEGYSGSFNNFSRDIKRKRETVSEQEKQVKRPLYFRRSRSPEPCRKSAFSRLSAPTAASQVELNLAQKPRKASPAEICQFSGFKVSAPVIDAVKLGAVIDGKRSCQLSQIPLLAMSFNRTDWVTFAIVVTKLPTKIAKSGSEFAIWKITDLENTSILPSLFIFGDARKLSAQISPGTVVAILNASIMPKRDGKSDLAICINNSAQLIEIGFAEDAGSCKGEAKGGSCKNLVNKSKSEYCMYHLRAALQKNGSHRMDLQSNWSGVEPKLSRIGKAADGVFYGGQMFAAPNAPAEQKKVSQKPLGKPIGKEAQARIEEGRNLIRKQFTDPEKKVLDNMTTENNELNRFVTADGPGSRNLVRSFTSDDFRSRPRQLISPSQALRNEQTSMQKLLAEQKQLALAKCSTAPQLGRSEASDDVIVIGARKKPANSSQVTGEEQKTNSSSSDRPNAHCTTSQARAIAELQRSGKRIAREDPNRMSRKLSAYAREHVQNIIPEVPVPVEATKVRICNLQDDPEIQALLNETAYHSDLYNPPDVDFRDEDFDDDDGAMESLEKQTEEIREVECTVVTCKKCKYTASSLADSCLKERHYNYRHIATKRCFQCKNCSKRKSSYVVLPSPCKICAGETFQRCGMTACE